MDLKLIEDIMSYIENAEEDKSWERGEGHTAEQLTQSGRMPAIYYQLQELSDMATSQPEVSSSKLIDAAPKMLEMLQGINKSLETYPMPVIAPNSMLHDALRKLLSEVEKSEPPTKAQ